MELRQVRYALAVAEHLGFLRAAQTMGVSQSVVSRGVARLEDELGITLFERTATGVRVTETGRAFLNRAERPYRELAEHQAYASSASRAEVGSLAIGFHPDLSAGILRVILSSHRRQWPDVAVRLFEDAPATQLVALRERRLDVCFLTSTFRTPGAESEALWDEQVVVAIPDDHPLSSAEQLEWTALREEAFVVRRYPSGPAIAAWLASCLGFEGIPSNVAQHDISRASMFGLVACGYGMSACSSSAAGVSYPGVRFVRIVGERSTVPVRVAWLAESFNPALQRFLRHARDVAHEAEIRPDPMIAARRSAWRA